MNVTFTYGKLIVCDWDTVAWIAPNKEHRFDYIIHFKDGSEYSFHVVNEESFLSLVENAMERYAQEQRSLEFDWSSLRKARSR
jgi:hypothetical protein